MPDNYANLNPEEQNYFDTQGAEVPAAEPPAEAPKQEPVKAPVQKKAAKAAKPAAEVEGEVAEAAPVEPPKRSAEQEQIENLNAALREERQGRKEFETKANERLRLLQEAIVARQEQAKPPAASQETPDPEKDPMGALKMLLAQAKENRQVHADGVQETERRQQEQRIMGEASRLEMEYLREQPDFDAGTGNSPSYNEASAFLVNMRRAELAALGTYNPVQINQIVAQEAIGLAAQALQAGKNPARIVFELAKVRGFAPKAKEVPVVEVPAETEQQKLARISKGQEAGFSLGQAGGSKAPNNKQFDAKTLASMNDEDFSAFVNKAKKSELRSLMGD